MSSIYIYTYICIYDISSLRFNDLKGQKQNSFTITDYENAFSGHSITTCGRKNKHGYFSKLSAAT